MKRNTIFMLITSIILLYYGISGIVREFSRIGTDLIETEGRIVSIHEKASAKGAAVHPVVTFRDEAGNEITFTSKTGSSSYKNQVGEIIKVTYPAGYPEDAWIKYSLAKNLSPAIFIIAGSVLFAMWYSKTYKSS